MAILMRWIEEEKQEKKRRFLAAPKMSSRRGMTAFSLGVKPVRSTLVESWRRTRTPCLPRSAKAWRSKGWPSGEERSILKSPVLEDDADGGVDGERDAVDEGVRDADGEDGKDAEVEAAAGEDFDEFGVVEEAMLFELAFDVGEGELGAVDGDVEVGEDPGEAADVVLVAVGEDDAADFGAVLDEVGDVRDDDVDAEELFFGEHEAGVDHDDVVAVVECEAVHAELRRVRRAGLFAVFH